MVHAYAFPRCIAASLVKTCRDAIMQWVIETKDSVIDLLIDGYQR